MWHQFTHSTAFPWIFGICFIAFFVVAIAISEQNAGEIHDELDKFMAKAKASKDIAELWALNAALIDYTKKKCWHRHFSNHAKEVNTYICGKVAGLKIKSESHE